MKLTKILKSILFTAVIMASGATLAYSPEELAKECHKPKFTDFTLKEYKAPENIETAPESEFSFKVPAFTNPETIKVTIKDHAIPFTVESNASFHKVKAKLPAEFTGKFARLNVSAKVIDGECHETTGWLLKVADKAAVEAAPAIAKPEPVAVETVPVATEAVAPAVTPASAEASAEPAK
jgi:hypothetical protein